MSKARSLVLILLLAILTISSVSISIISYNDGFAITYHKEIIGKDTTKNNADQPKDNQTLIIESKMKGVAYSFLATIGSTLPLFIILISKLKNNLIPYRKRNLYFGISACISILLLFAGSSIIHGSSITLLLGSVLYWAVIGFIIWLIAKTTQLIRGGDQKITY